MASRTSHVNILRAPRDLVLLAAIALLAGCGNLTAGGLSETEVVISGDAAEPLPAASLQQVGDPARQSGGDDEADGELEAEFSLYLEGGSQGSIPLTFDPVRVRVDVQGLREEGASTAVIPAGTYTTLRIVFTEVEVEVVAGLIVDGQEVTGLIDVELEADSAVVTRPVNLRLADGDRVEILVDLNAQDWLLEVDPALLVVPEEFFANAIEVRVR